MIQTPDISPATVPLPSYRLEAAMRPLHNLLIAILLVPVSNAAVLPVPPFGGPPLVQDELSGEKRKALEQLLPEAEEFGFRTEGEPSFFVAETLYEYINGASEAFLDFGFTALIQQLYQRGRTEVTVDIYDMGNALNGFGIYSAERSTDYDFIQLGAEGYQADYILNFVQGRYYVKLSAFGDDAESAEVLSRFGQALSQRIPESRELPEEFLLFPRANRIPHSERYLKRSPLGYEFLSPAIQVGYRTGGHAYTVMITLAESASEAGEKADRLRRSLGREGTVESLPDWPGSAFRASTRYQGAVVAGVSKSFLVVLIDPPPEAKSCFQSLVNRLNRGK